MVKHQVILAIVVGFKLLKAVTASRRVLVEVFRRVFIVGGEELAVPVHNSKTWNRISQRLNVAFMTILVNRVVFARYEEHSAIATLWILDERRDHVEDPVAVVVHNQMALSIEPQVAIKTRMLAWTFYDDRCVVLL